jgi:hypothetical protein
VLPTILGGLDLARMLSMEVAPSATALGPSGDRELAATLVRELLLGSGRNPPTTDVQLSAQVTLQSMFLRPIDCEAGAAAATGAGAGPADPAAAAADQSTDRSAMVDRRSTPSSPSEWLLRLLFDCRLPRATELSGTLAAVASSPVPFCVLLGKALEHTPLGAPSSAAAASGAAAAAAFSSSPSSPRRIAEQLLEEELDTLRGTPWRMSAAPWLRDAVLEGHFVLVLALVRALDRRDEVGLEGRGGLIRLLMTRYLFPEGELRAQMAADALDVSIAAFCLESRCAAWDCRRAALALLSELISAGPAALRECVDNLHRIHYVGPNGIKIYQPQFVHLETLPSPLRTPDSYVGLTNGGATCYMNSVFQQVGLDLFFFNACPVLLWRTAKIESGRTDRIRSNPIDRSFFCLLTAKNRFGIGRPTD